MRAQYQREEIEHLGNVPARVLHQILEGEECSVPFHWHEDTEINLMLYGKAIFTVNGQVSTLYPEDFIIINSQDLHRGTADPSIPLQNRRQELVTLQFDTDLLSRYLDTDRTIRLQMPKDPEIAQKIRALILAIGIQYLRREVSYKIDITASILQIISLLLRFCVIPEADQEDQALQIKIKEMQQAVTFIDEHCREDLTLNDVADHVHLAPAYFSRRFRQITGSTYHDYLTATRLKKSIPDLKDTDLTVTEIAFQNGFPNVRSFITAFKKQYQMTPQKYRAECGQS